MQNKTFIEHLCSLRQFVVYLFVIFLLTYLVSVIITHLYIKHILNYIIICTGLKSIYYSGVYDKFLFPFSLSYYIAIIVVINILIIGFVHRLWKNKIKTIGTIIGLGLNWYLIYCYILPYGVRWLFTDILRLETNSNIIFLPQLVNILNTIFYVILCGLLTLYLPLISGLLVNYNDKLKTSFFSMGFVIISGILAPADPISHLVMALTMIVSFKITTFCGKIRKRLWKK